MGASCARPSSTMAVRFISHRLPGRRAGRRPARPAGACTASPWASGLDEVGARAGAALQRLRDGVAGAVGLAEAERPDLRDRAGRGRPDLVAGAVDQQLEPGDTPGLPACGPLPL